ncbi:DUF3426 domain-containing protein [Thioalkalivibrio sulfidiphilus]|uniref:DUF3426 domain-containing protein n=1 Tax=Thioalkalivibrio sulfidiphilus TaxID=1033854 RepID=UPI003B383465
MYTQCPHCQAVFRVTTADLTLSDGQVRCGECLAVFNGMDSLSVLPPESAEETSPPPALKKSPTPAAAVAEPEAIPSEPAPAAPEQVEPATGQPASPSAPAVSKPAVPLALRDELETAAEGPGGRAIAGTLALGLLCALLIALLGAQVLYHERERLAVYPELSPAIERMCTYLGCTTAERREPQAFQVTQRNIYSHPNAENALMVQASFVNGAGFTQPLPQVELSFRDLQGALVAVRRFSPQEYLPQGRAPEPVAPRDVVDLSLEIEDPGARAVAYEFRFL